MPASVAPRSRLAGYVIERLLGTGGMGSVYLAREEALDRPVALKLLLPELAQDDVFRERFLEEMRLAASLEHPHVCPVYAAGEVDGMLYLALRYLEGDDVASVVGEEGPVMPERAIALVANLAGALDRAHAHGLVHRDVKPENVLLDRYGNAYLADFGLAQPLWTRGVTRTDELAGTLLYMAPERIGGEEASPASDLYAFGCLAYFLLAGTPPFVRSHEAALLFAHLRDDVPSLGDRGLARLDAVLRQALAKRPDERYSSCSAFASALAEASASAEPREAVWPESLPRARTSFLGRDRELGELAALVSEGARIVTLTGPGGTGKTRLCLELAARLAEGFDDGAVWVSLAALRDPALALPTISRALDDPETEAADVIGERRLLVCLDNLEQLLPEVAAPIASLVDSCPGLTLVGTSRSPLHVERERTYAVPSLREAEAVSLFHDRAERLGPTGQANGAVSEICRRLDCLPLAVELAAARTTLLSPEALLSRLEATLPLLTGGPRDAPARQQTLASTLDWSYELLHPEEQALLARLSIFRGGFTLEAAEQVCGAELESLAALLDASLVRRRDTLAGDARFDLLAIVREYATGKRDGEETLALGRGHAEHFLELVERAVPELTGPRQGEWFARFDAEHDNLRSAIDWSTEHEPGAALRFGAVLWRWWQRGYLTEGREALARALARTSKLDDAAGAAALRGAGILARTQGDNESAEGLLERSLAAYRAIGDTRGVAHVLQSLGNVATQRFQLDVARARFEETLAAARELADKGLISSTLSNLGVIARRSGDNERARELYEESLALDRELGDSRGQAHTLVNLALALNKLGESEAAEERIRESIGIFFDSEEPVGIAHNLSSLAMIHAPRGPERGARFWGASDRLFAELGIDNDDPENLAVQESTRASLGDALFDAAYRAGRDMPVEEVVADVLAG